MDEGEGGAGDVRGGSSLESFRDALDQGSFTGAQSAAQQDDERRGKFGGELAAEGDGLLSGIGDDAACHAGGPSITMRGPFGGGGAHTLTVSQILSNCPSPDRNRLGFSPASDNSQPLRDSFCRGVERDRFKVLWHNHPCFR